MRERVQAAQPSEDFLANKERAVSATMTDRIDLISAALDFDVLKDALTSEDWFDPEKRDEKLARNADIDDYLAERPGLDELELEIAATGEELLESLVEEFSGLGVQSDITNTFIIPELVHHRRSKVNKLGMEIDDVRDNLMFKGAPYAAEHVGPEAAKLMERLLPKEAQQAIRIIGKRYEPGANKVRRIQVGNNKKEKAGHKDPSFHTHFYFLDRTHEGVTRMYFVDPENMVAKNMLLRPSIANLVGIEVPDDENQASRVTVLRYQIPVYDVADKLTAMKTNDLREVIAQTLDNGGNLPDNLTGEEESKLLFMISASPEESRVQARYSSGAQVRSFAKGEKGSSALEGKIYTQLYVLQKLLELLKDPSHEKIKDVRKKPLES